jgi:hypothetical protein
VVQQLPPPHFRTLEYLTRHVARVAENNASTGMTAKNVAIVWAPNLLRCKELEFGGFQPQLVGRRVQPTDESSRSSGPSPPRDGEDFAVRFAGDGGDESIQDGSLSRCHNRSVSHDSYFRLLMTSRTGSMQVDPLDDRGGQRQSGSQRMSARTVQRRHLR